MNDVAAMKEVIKQRWSGKSGAKVQRYVGKFWDRTRRGQHIMAQVEGNHGTYKVSIHVQDSLIASACSCYIGKHGYCHHCAALAHTFLKDPDSFIAIESVSLAKVTGLDDLKRYLNGKTLDDLTKELRARGITQKAFAESIGMSSQKLGAIKRSELRNRHFHELGAVKLACLWVLQNLTEDK